MAIEAQQEMLNNPFQPAREAFESLLSELSSDETLSLTHSAVEALLEERGQELMRRAFQGHLDLRGPGRALGVVESGSGVPLSYERLSSRNLETQFGNARFESPTRIESRSGCVSPSRRPTKFQVFGPLP